MASDMSDVVSHLLAWRVGIELFESTRPHLASRPTARPALGFQFACIRPVRDRNAKGAGMDARPEVAVVVVNWNAVELTQRCLDSLVKQRADEPVLTVVVDNGSADGSADTLERRNPGIPVLRRAVNGGFGAGVNEALRSPALTGVRFVVLLNNDAIAEPGFLDAIVRPLREDPTVAAATARILLDGRWRRADDAADGAAGKPVLADSRGAAWVRADSSGLVLTNSTGNVLDHAGNGMDRDWLAPHPVEADREVFGFSGGAAALRVSALDRVGLFDESLFMYYEDTELSWRLRRAGWGIVYAPDALVRHEHAASSGTGSRLFLVSNTRNRLAVSLLHAPPGMLARGIARTVGRLARLAVRGVHHGDVRPELSAVAAGLASWAARTPGLIRRRITLNTSAVVSTRTIVREHLGR
jgi:N-acetylglucosaminyl-diphospho-decaprenol L-rhamnosyltransferase